MSGLNQKMRVWHRYLGFYLVGIMAVYAVSGTVLIFRKTDSFKQDKIVESKLSTNLTEEEVKESLGLEKELSFIAEDSSFYFDGGSYNSQTGIARQTKKEYPFLLDKLIKLHKATTYSPIYWLNIFFGASLLFFVVSSFWMFLPHTDVFRKGLYFSLAGIVMTVVILFL